MQCTRYGQVLDTLGWVHVDIPYYSHHNWVVVRRRGWWLARWCVSGMSYWWQCPVGCVSSAVPQWYLYLQYYNTRYGTTLGTAHGVECVHCCTACPMDSPCACCRRQWRGGPVWDTVAAPSAEVHGLSTGHAVQQCTHTTPCAVPSVVPYPVP